MKIKKKVSIFCLFVFISLWTPRLWAQCLTTVYLCSQASVDAFPKMYPGCRSIDALYIDTQNCFGAANDIKNLDSLIQLESIGSLYLISLSKIDNINGLANVRKINFMRIQAQKSWNTPLNIDSIGYIDYRFPIDTISDIRLLSNVKYVEFSLSFIGNGSLVPPMNFRTKGNFGIGISNNNRNNRILNVLPKNSSDGLLGLGFVLCQNIDCNLGFIPDTINYIGITNSQKLDFNTWKSVKKIGALNIARNPTIDTSHRFMAESIDDFYIASNSPEFRLEDIFPKLKEITTTIHIGDNKKLSSISFFDNFALPILPSACCNNGVPEDFYKYIRISDNPVLNTCESDYLCRAFKRYGDTIWVKNNLIDCNNELLTKQCLSSTSEDIEKSQLHYFPNPVYDRLTIDGLETSTTYFIYNSLGQIVQTGTVLDNIDMSSLGAGYYIIKLGDQNRNHSAQVLRVVKLE